MCVEQLNDLKSLLEQAKAVFDLMLANGDDPWVLSHDTMMVLHDYGCTTEAPAMLAPCWLLCGSHSVVYGRR
jgi:hypothetical protein